MQQTIFITGGTGYIGRRLIAALLKKNYSVVALVRTGSENKAPAGCKVIVADPFEVLSLAATIPAGCAFVQLLGVPHPSPKKPRQFYDIDLKSVQTSAEAAKRATCRKFGRVHLNRHA